MDLFNIDWGFVVHELRQIGAVVHHGVREEEEEDGTMATRRAVEVVF